MTPERWYVLWWLAWSAGAVVALALVLRFVVTRPILLALKEKR